MLDASVNGAPELPACYPEVPRVFLAGPAYFLATTSVLTLP